MGGWRSRIKKETIKARGLIRGGLLHDGSELCEGEGDIEAVTLGRGEEGQPIQKLREVPRIRGEGNTGIHWVKDLRGGGEEKGEGVAEGDYTRLVSSFPPMGRVHKVHLEQRRLTLEQWRSP